MRVLGQQLSKQPNFRNLTRTIVWAWQVQQEEMQLRNLRLEQFQPTKLHSLLRVLCLMSNQVKIKANITNIVTGETFIRISNSLYTHSALQAWSIKTNSLTLSISKQVQSTLMPLFGPKDWLNRAMTSSLGTNFCQTKTQPDLWEWASMTQKKHQHQIGN